ncbi:MAG: hypothetical protein ACLTT1_12025 [[Clostridium] scindens]
MENKMSREDRAKQFMPFAALKGYPEALRKKEKVGCSEGRTFRRIPGRIKR